MVRSRVLVQTEMNRGSSPVACSTRPNSAGSASAKRCPLAVIEESPPMRSSTLYSLWPCRANQNVTGSEGFHSTSCTVRLVSAGCTGGGQQADVTLRGQVRSGSARLLPATADAAGELWGCGGGHGGSHRAQAVSRGSQPYGGAARARLHSEAQILLSFFRKHKLSADPTTCCASCGCLASRPTSVPPSTATANGPSHAEEATERCTTGWHDQVPLHLRVAACVTFVPGCRHENFAAQRGTSRCSGGQRGVRVSQGRGCAQGRL